MQKNIYRSLSSSLIFILLLVCSYSMTTTYQFTHSSNCPNGKLKRVSKLVKATFDFTLNSNNLWAQYMNLQMEIKIPFEQIVTITKHIAMNGEGKGPGRDCAFLTRVMINNVDSYFHRHAIDVYGVRSYSISKQMLLSPGIYRLRVDYRTDCTYSQIKSQWDWVANYLETVYYQCQSNLLC